MLCSLKRLEIENCNTLLEKFGNRGRRKISIGGFIKKIEGQIGIEFRLFNKDLSIYFKLFFAFDDGLKEMSNFEFNLGCGHVR